MVCGKFATTIFSKEGELRHVKKYDTEVKQFGLNLKRIRTEKGMSQQELADLCDIERSTIARVELGTYGVGLRIIFSISETLHIDPADLFTSQSSVVK